MYKSNYLSRYYKNTKKDALKYLKTANKNNVIIFLK